MSRIATLFRRTGDSLTIETITDYLRSIEARIIQIINWFISLFTTATYTPFNYITTFNTTTQGIALEGFRVPFEYEDNWTVNIGSPQNFTNVTQTYNLPPSCEGVQVFLNHTNITDSCLVSNLGCNYTVINNLTLTPGNSSLISINYTTVATSSSEGTWIPVQKIVGEKTIWVNTITVSNPSTVNYTNVSINMTGDNNSISSENLVRNSTWDVLISTYNATNGNLNWTDDINNGSSDVFTMAYNSSEINLSAVNYTDTIGGVDFNIYNISVSTNSSRDIPNVQFNFTFEDTGVVSNKIFKCSDGFDTCTEDITNRLDVSFSDNDGDSLDDSFLLFITNLSENQSYQLKSNKGLPVQITKTKDILNKPIKPFDNVEWRITITMYNPNPFETTVVEKHEFPSGVRILN